MFSRFGKGRGQGAGGHGEERSRPSRGWAEVLSYLKGNESLRVLDFGTTSPQNINFLTALGHSVYMANVVQDANRPEWQRTSESGEPEYDIEGFVKSSLDFSGRDFDVILLWDTANFLPPAMVPAMFDRLGEVLRPQGKLLALFHGKTEGPETGFSRYQLSDTDQLTIVPAGDYPVRQVYQMRQIEKLLEGYASTRFFLGKDNMREVIAVK
ncbi:MAG TPA: class I SAM-dependent methyltransferase [Acidobacteriaceae bacterium]|nr:class I SAM-dependent methyltransferase [Acidobacteriaceae bacterium]